MLLSSLTPRINVFGASCHLSGSLHTSFWLVTASQSWLLIGWLWAPAHKRPRLLHHLPHCGHDTDNLSHWEKWRAATKWKSETRLTTTLWCGSPLCALLAEENVLAVCVGWEKYAHIREKDPDRFSATRRAHLCFDYLCLRVVHV